MPMKLGLKSIRMQIAFWFKYVGMGACVCVGARAIMFVHDEKFQQTAITINRSKTMTNTKFPLSWV